MDHNTVKSSLVYSDFSGPLEPLDVFLDLWDSKGSRGDGCTTDLDVGWADGDDVLTWAFGFEDFGISGRTDGPQLEVDE